MKCTKLVPDLKAATAFLRELDPAGVYTFQTFADKKDRNTGALARVFHGSLEQHQPELTRLQQLGAGAFVMINEGDGLVHLGEKTCRTKANIVAVRALWADLDGSPLEPVIAALQPDIVVESSSGRWHCYWIVKDLPLDDFRKRQQQIAKKFNSDPAVCDLPRVMRIPGFWHQKAEPFMTHMIFPV